MKILSMSGYVPEEICDTIRFENYPGERNISHYCGYAADFISQTLHDDTIDGAVFPHSCDSSRIIKNHLEGCSKFIYQLNIPIRQDRAAAVYFADILRDYKSALECHYAVTINNIAERAEFAAKRNEYLRELYSCLDSISYSHYISLIHSMLKKPLFEQLDNICEPKKTASDGKRVFLVGSFLSNIAAADLIESCGMKIVADDLPESGRMTARKKLKNGDIYEAIAENILNGRLSPTQNNFNALLSDDMEIIKKRNAEAVIFVTQKYCEPYDYLYSVYKKMLDENNIPSIKISLTDTGDIKNARLPIETFAASL